MKSRKISLFCVSWLLVLQGCGYSHQQHQIPELLINPNASPGSEITLNDLVESIRYVPLETSDNSLISEIGEFDISTNYILVSCQKSASIFLFGIDGRFISQIGRKGQGPGEYNMIDNIFIDEKNQQILVSTKYPDKIITYNFKGEHTELLPIKESNDMRRSTIRAFSNDNFLAMYPNTPNADGESDYTYEIRNRHYQLVGKGLLSVPYTVYGVPDPNASINIPFYESIYRYDDLICVKENFLNDTIYYINSQNEFVPKYTLKAGEYDITVDIRSDFNNSFERLSRCVHFHYVYETDDYLLISYRYMGEKNICFYDKRSQDIIYQPEREAIPNDYDGGPDFLPEKQDNKLWYTFFEALHFKEELSMPKKTTPKGSEEALDHIKSINQNLTDDDNPVLAIVSLK